MSSETRDQQTARYAGYNETMIEVAGILGASVKCPEQEPGSSVFWGGYRFTMPDGTAFYAGSPDGYDHKGKWHFSPDWPRNGRDYFRPYKDEPGYGLSINVSATKTPKQIAADVSRRLLPELVPAYAAMAARAKEYADHDQRTKSLAAHLAALAGETCDGDKWSHYKSGAGYIQSCYTCGDNVSFDLRSVSKEQAEQIIKIMVAS